MRRVDASLIDELIAPPSWEAVQSVKVVGVSDVPETVSVCVDVTSMQSTLPSPPSPPFACSVIFLKLHEVRVSTADPVMWMRDAFTSTD